MIINNVVLYIVVRKFEICRIIVNVSNVYRILIFKILNIWGYVCVYV